jgi:hypothetical protein
LEALRGASAKIMMAVTLRRGVHPEHCQVAQVFSGEQRLFIQKPGG